MLGLEPKDFDVGTDARPGEIRRLFRNSRIIGRRFRLAHVMFQDGVIEVSTFRSDPDPGEQNREPGELLVTSDNTFGTPQQDAFRRDFTVNALFYSIADFSVIDYVGGIDDLRKGMMRVIGNPALRFREDPVRMLRACEFAGRLGFGIEARTQESIYEHRGELDKASPARLTEELIQLLRCGRSGAAVQWMVELGLLERLLPEIGAMMTTGGDEVGDFSRVLPVIDAMMEAGEEVSDVVLLSAILAPSLLLDQAERERRRGRPVGRGRLRTMTEEAVASFSGRFSLSHQRTQQVFHTLDTFHRLCEPPGSDEQQRRIARRASFADGLAVFEILVRATGGGSEVLDEWRRLAETTPRPRREERQPARPQRSRGRRPRRRGRRRRD
jgi:poly(A) polymerase